MSAAQPARAPLAEPAGLASRRAAFRAVAETMQGGGALDDLLARTETLEPRDAALARAIAITTFRRFGSIWAALESRLDRGMPEDSRAGALLMTGAAQILVLDVPDRAAVDLAVTLARTEPNLAHVAGLANAVLRRLSRERDAALAEADADAMLDTPPWLASRWTAAYGVMATRDIAAAHRRGAAVDATLKAGPAAPTAPADPADWAVRLGGAILPTGSIRLPERAAIASLPGFAEGAWWVQDAAAAIPARMLGDVAGLRVADLCAAPGGKTAQLAAAGAAVTAVDRSAPRLRRLVANMGRLGLTVATATADAASLAAEPFDAILLDAPCTATGTIRRHPDVAWTKRESDLASLVALQARLLDRAADLLRPGGLLVYCVCSLEPEEGERQVEALLGRRRDLALAPLRPGEIAGTDGLVDAQGRLRTRPDMWGDLGAARPGLDGFFAARMRRLSSA